SRLNSFREDRSWPASQERKVGESASIQGKVENGSFVNDRRNATRLGFDRPWFGRNRNIFSRSGNLKLKFDFGHPSQCHAQEWTELRRHLFRGHARGVVAGRQQSEGEPPFDIGNLLVVERSRI